MPLEIIGAGYGRTGTLSTYTALKELGFPCYHMLEIMNVKANKWHLGFWHKVANQPQGRQHDWEQVFQGYRAAVDNPACCVWRELLVAYPDAKVLLTLHPRGADAWYESTIDTIYFTEVMWQWKLLEFFTPFARKFGDMSRKLIWGRNHNGSVGQGRAAAVAEYERHIADVKASVPADRLLVFSVTEGWTPLCAFLDKPVPSTQFPNVNDRAEIKKIISGLTIGAYGIVGAGVLAAVALTYAAVWFWG